MIILARDREKHLDINRVLSQQIASVRDERIRAYIPIENVSGITVVYRGYLLFLVDYQIYTQQKKLMKLCLRGYDKRSKTLKDF